MADELTKPKKLFSSTEGNVQAQKSLSEVNGSIAVPHNAGFWRTLKAYMGQKKIQYYTDYNTDLVTNANQEVRLPQNYVWNHPGHWYALKSVVVYRTMFEFGQLYWKLGLHAHIVGYEKLAAFRHQSYFMYGNHTQPVGDPFMPLLLAGWQRVSTLAVAANLGVPFFGRILQLGGGVILPETIPQTRRFMTYLKNLVQAGRPIAIYPETHVWPYYTKIRPFVSGAFHYPVTFQLPIFTFTTTYQKHGITVFVDGPFYPDQSQPARTQRQAMAKVVQNTMQQRAKASTYSHIDYRRRQA